VNLDYADLMTIMKAAGVAMIGIGETRKSGPDRLRDQRGHWESPLLGEVDLNPRPRRLVRVVGGPDLTVSEARSRGDRGPRDQPAGADHLGCSVEDDRRTRFGVLLVITGVKSKSLLGRRVHGPRRRPPRWTK